MTTIVSETERMHRTIFSINPRKIICNLLLPDERTCTEEHAAIYITDLISSTYKALRATITGNLWLRLYSISEKVTGIRWRSQKS